MALVNKQAEKYREIEESLQAKRPVLLTGKSNGKTTLVHNALEVLARRDEVKAGFAPAYVSPPRHPGDRAIDYVTRIYFSPRNSSVTVPGIARQILIGAGLRPGHTCGDVMVNFEKYLKGKADEGRMLCLAVDNAELLPENAYTVLKALHEYIDPVRRRAIGVGLLIAGDITDKRMYKRMPHSFKLRCDEVTIGKIDPADVLQLITILYPKEARFWTDEAIRRVSKCATSTQMRAAIDQCAIERKRNRLTDVNEDLVEEKLANILLAKAA